MRERATLKSMAMEMKISVSAVSRVLNGKGKVIGLSDNTINRIKEHALGVGYRPQINARNLRIRKTAIIGVIFPTLQDYNEDLQHRLFKGVALAARERNHSIVFFDITSDTDGDEAIQQCLDLNVDGIIASHIALPGYLERLRKEIVAGVNVVMLLNNTADEFDCPNVVVDDFSGGIFAVERLLEKGCARIAYLAHRNEKESSGFERFRGYKSALESNGISYDETLVIDVSKETNYEEVNELLTLDPAVDGVFCHNDLCALQAARVVERAGAAIEIVGFDNRDFIRYLNHPFDTVDMPLVEVGEKAVEILLKGERSPAKCEITPELVFHGENDVRPRVAGQP